MRIAAAAIVLLAGAASHAVTIAPGDIAAAPPWCVPGCVAAAPPPVFYLLDRNMNVKQSLRGMFMAFGPNGHLFASAGTSVTEYDAALTAVRTFTRFSTVAVTVAQNGNLFALAYDGVLTIYSPTGAVMQTISLPFTVDPFVGHFPLLSLDLAPDQCTLFYIDRVQTGRRYDVCTLQPLANLPSGPWYAVRAMSDGGYAAANDSTLSIFDAHDHLLRAYTPPAGTIYALAFDSDPRFILVGTMTGLDRIRLADGVSTGHFTTPIDSVAVNGEQRAAAALLSTGIPTLSPILLFAVALGLMALAWQRLRA